MAKAKEIYAFLNTIAPFDTQENWDNSGLLVGDPEKECRKISLCLDITSEAIEAAYNYSADLIISHHPVIFGAKKRFLKGEPAYELAAKDICAICAHTCLDLASGGVNDALAQALELSDVQSPFSGDGAYLRIGSLKNEMNADELAEYIKSKLGASCVRYSASSRNIKTVAVCGGSGADFMEYAAQKADAYITGDAGHHVFLDAQHMGLPLFAAGHFETENPVIPRLKAILEAKFPDALFQIIEQDSPIKSI